MVQEEITYELSLETMNEEGLRAECVRLKNKLDMIHVQQLTQTKPMETEGRGIYKTICAIKQEIEQLKENPSKANLRDDVEELIDIVDGLVFVVGQINTK